MGGKRRNLLNHAKEGAGFKARVLLFAALAAGSIVSCQTSPKPETQPIDAKPLAQFSVRTKTDFGADGCKNMVDDYCSHLYSPEVNGNLIIGRRQSDGLPPANRPIQILRGETSNQLPQVFVKYSLAKIRNRYRLPTDLQERLNQLSYFEKLETLIRRAPIGKMSLSDRLYTERLEAELDFIWETAVDQTVVIRMSRKFPGYHQIPERAMPIEYSLEKRRSRRILISEVSRILWHEDSNWKKVEDEFRLLKLSFLALFDRLDISEDVRSNWRKKIQTVELVLPGSSPEISDEECSATNANAYYYRNLNLITVCAGDFNSEDIVLTLAHEMSHALGVDRDLLQFLSSSPLSQKMVRLRDNVCERREQLSCEDWADFKKSFAESVGELNAYKPQLPQFNRCLKKGPTQKSIAGEDADRIGNSIATARTSNLASSNVFLRIIEKKVPIRSGRLQSNPNFMNPCGYYLWSSKKESLDDELYELVFFTAEYQCGEGPKNLRLKNAIETAKNLSSKLLSAVIAREGEFSSRPELVSEGYSSPPFERFADVMGAYAVSQYLQRFQDLAERRSKYLASATWLCGEPSLETHFPEESKVEQSFSLEPHAQRDNRKLEIFTEPLRQTLQCHQDFKFDECQLPFRHSLPGGQPTPASTAPEEPQRFFTPAADPSSLPPANR